MSIVEVTTQISRQWLMRKSKDELVSIILHNLDSIDLFSEARPTLPVLREVAEAAEKATDEAWAAILDDIWQEARDGKAFENWPLAASARRALQKLRSLK